MNNLLGRYGKEHNKTGCICAYGLVVESTCLLMINPVWAVCGSFLEAVFIKVRI